MARKPNNRPELPARKSDNDKRRLDPTPDQAEIAAMIGRVHFKGSPKHKRHPHLFNLEPYNGKRGDDSLCDEHANFGVRDMLSIPALLVRGINAGLLGGRILWTVADDGWIFEARLTNAEQHEYHGYPVRPTEAIARPVYERFVAWATEKGARADIAAARACAARYGFD